MAEEQGNNRRLKQNDKEMPPGLAVTEAMVARDLTMMVGELVTKSGSCQVLNWQISRCRTHQREGADDIDGQDMRLQ